jgi:hypothetical protein
MTCSDAAVERDCYLPQDMLAQLKTARKAGSVAAVLHIAALTQEVCSLKQGTLPAVITVTIGITSHCDPIPALQATIGCQNP